MLFSFNPRENLFDVVEAAHQAGAEVEGSHREGMVRFNYAATRASVVRTS